MTACLSRSLDVLWYKRSSDLVNILLWSNINRIVQILKDQRVERQETMDPKFMGWNPNPTGNRTENEPVRSCDKIQSYAVLYDLSG